MSRGRLQHTPQCLAIRKAWEPRSPSSEGWHVGLPSPLRRCAAHLPHRSRPPLSDDQGPRTTPEWLYVFTLQFLYLKWTCIVYSTHLSGTPFRRVSTFSHVIQKRIEITMRINSMIMNWKVSSYVCVGMYVYIYIYIYIYMYAIITESFDLSNTHYTCMNT